MKKPRKKRVIKPKHTTETRAWCFALRRDQDHSPLFRALDIAHALRNDIAQARQENSLAIRAAKQNQLPPPKRLTKRQQEMVFAERRKLEPKGAGLLHSLVVKNIIDRIDEGYQRFFDALTAGRPNVKPPKPIKRDRYRSLTFPQYGNGVRIRNGKVELSMIGSFRLHDHRKIRGKIKSVTIKWKHGRWWCIALSEMQAADVFQAARVGARDTGADPGLSAVVTFSDGRSLDPPRALAEASAKLRKQQRIMSRKFEAQKKRQSEEQKAAKAEKREPVRLPLSNRLRRQIVEVGKVHTKVSNVRDHWHKLAARRTAQRYKRVGYETHGLMFMIKNRRLAKAASDRALGMQAKAFASALGPRLVLVPNQRPGLGGNSQTCLCGASVPKTLSDRWHNCDSCGLSASRDVVSANICELIAFGTHTISTAPGRGPIDAEVATSHLRENALGTGEDPSELPLKASTSCSLRSEKTTGGHGLRWEARPGVIGTLPLAREPETS